MPFEIEADYTQVLVHVIFFYGIACYILLGYRKLHHILHYYAKTLKFCYRAMHFSEKRGIAIACRLSVCDVGELWSHRLEFFENNFTIS